MHLLYSAIYIDNRQNALPFSKYIILLIWLFLCFVQAKLFSNGRHN